MDKKKTTLLWALLAVCAYGETNSIDLGKSVIYSTTGFATEVRKTAANPTLVTAEDIQKKNYNTVEEVLRDIPAINIVRQGKDYIIDLRGQGDKAKQNVQILVDGVQMNSLDTSMSATPINTISPDDIERIEVIPGGGSVLYGSGTSGGVVNIITKKGTGRRVNAGYEYGSYANKKANIAVGETIGNFDINLSYTNQSRDGYRDYDKSDSDAFMGNIGYKISDTQDINFKYSKYKAEESYPGMLTREQVEVDRTQSGMEDGEWSTTDTDKDEYVLTYNNKLTSNLDFNLTGFYQKTTMDLSSNTFIMGPTLPFKMEQTSKFEDEKWGIKPKFKYSYGQGSNLILGMDYINNKATRYANTYTVMPSDTMFPPIVGRSITTNDLKKETISGFLMNNYVWNDFEFNQGIRYEKANYDVTRGTIRTNGNNDTPISVDKSEDNFAYELGANWLYSDTGKTYVRYEKGFTSPPPALLTNKDEKTGDYYLNDLKSETYDNIEIGLSDYIGFTSINASIFYTLTKDEITQDMAKGMPPAWIKNYNLGKTERFGFELSTAQYFDKLTLNQSWAYINAEIKDGKDGSVDVSGNHVANVPEHKLSFGAEYAFTPKFSIGGDIVYTDGVYMNNQNLGGKVNSHTVTNIRARYSFDFGLDIYGGINNLFDREYYETVGYSSGKYEYDPAAERNYYIGFRYSL